MVEHSKHTKKKTMNVVGNIKFNFVNRVVLCDENKTRRNNKHLTYPHMKVVKPCVFI